MVTGIGQQLIMNGLPELHQSALIATGKLVAGVQHDQWHLPTPDSEWDVRFLVNHIVSENEWVAPLVHGGNIAAFEKQLSGDRLGSEPSEAYDHVAEVCGAAFLEEGAMHTPVELSYGLLTGAQYCRHRLLDLVVHGWDLAEATGQDTTIDPDLLNAAYQIVEEEQDDLQASGVYGTPVKVSHDAHKQTRLLAMLGRKSRFNPSQA